MLKDMPRQLRAAKPNWPLSRSRRCLHVTAGRQLAPRVRCSDLGAEDFRCSQSIMDVLRLNGPLEWPGACWDEAGDTGLLALPDLEHRPIAAGLPGLSTQCLSAAKSSCGIVCGAQVRLHFRSCSLLSRSCCHLGAIHTNAHPPPTNLIITCSPFSHVSGMKIRQVPKTSPAFLICNLLPADP